jgi:hypothetical protein
VLVLLDLGHAPEALERALAYTITAAQLGPVDERLELARCLALARAGSLEAAAATDAVIERLRAANIAGLPLGAAHETRVHVAVALGDNDAIVEHLEACRAAYCAHRHPALTAKYQRLQLAARRSQRASLRPSASPEALTSFATPSRVSAALEACKDELQRAHLALTLLVAHSGAFAGFLFKVGDDGAVCTAQVGKLPLSAELSDRVSEFLREECLAAGTTCTATGVGGDEEEQLGWEDGMGQRYRPVLLSHHLDGDPLVTGVALLAIAPNTRFNHPGQVASEVSRAWAHFGDIVLTTPQR